MCVDMCTYDCVFAPQTGVGERQSGVPAVPLGVVPEGRARQLGPVSGGQHGRHGRQSLRHHTGRSVQTQLREGKT